MSLTDLKKSNKSAGAKRSFTVDEFIDDAEKYAVGKAEIVGSKVDNQLAVQKAISLANQEKEKKASQRRFRHATFTFNEQTFEQLNELAKESKLAKSHILRILISQLSSQEKTEQLKLLKSSDVE